MAKSPIFPQFLINFEIFQQISAQSIDQEIDMATNELSGSTGGLKTEEGSSTDSAKNQPKVTFEKDLEGQERRTRIAFLENQQAELETEIRLLRQNGKRKTK